VLSVNTVCCCNSAICFRYKHASRVYPADAVTMATSIVELWRFYDVIYAWTTSSDLQISSFLSKHCRCCLYAHKSSAVFVTVVYIALWRRGRCSVKNKFASSLQAHRSVNNCLASCLCNVAKLSFEYLYGILSLSIKTLVCTCYLQTVIDRPRTYYQQKNFSVIQ